MERRPNRTPRRQREKRAYQAVVVGGTASLVTVVGALLALFGIGSFAIPLLAALIAVAAFFVFRSQTG